MNNNMTPPNAPKKVNGNMPSYIGDIVPFDLSNDLPMPLLHRQHAFSTHNVCGICATPTCNDCSNHSDYLSLCDGCCPEIQENIPILNLNDDVNMDNRPVTPTGQRTSRKTIEYWSKDLAKKRKNARKVCLKKQFFVALTGIEHW